MTYDVTQCETPRYSDRKSDLSCNFLIRSAMRISNGRGLNDDSPSRLRHLYPNDSHEILTQGFQLSKAALYRSMQMPKSVEQRLCNA